MELSVRELKWVYGKLVDFIERHDAVMSGKEELPRGKEVDFVSMMIDRAQAYTLMQRVQEELASVTAEGMVTLGHVRAQRLSESCAELQLAWIKNAQHYLKSHKISDLCANCSTLGVIMMHINSGIVHESELKMLEAWQEEMKDAAK